MEWKGVMPAITTKFNEDLSVDFGFVAKHASWLVDNGCTGIVALGSLGEGACLDHDEKLRILETLLESVGGRVPVVATVSGLGTHQLIRLAKDAERIGCRGLMVLPAYAYKGSWREIKVHFSEVFGATGLSCMLYNNPIAYVVDVLPDQLAELADANANLHAVKESSADIRRVTAIRNMLGDRLAVFVGVDDLILEGVHAGACGWIAGLVNAFPNESVRLFNLCIAGEWEEAKRLYKWFLPLLRMDTVPEFIHLIKLVQQETGMGSELVRPPRQTLEGPIRQQALATLKEALAVAAG
jgi:4-hydroxy-tetrahydrodipicolinate synthase